MISNIKKQYLPYFNEYLLNSEYFLKYLNKNLYVKPKINKIVLSYNIIDFLKSIESKNKKTHNININTEIKSIYVYFLLYAVSSHINFISLESQSVKLNLESYSLKITLTKKKEITKFLYNFSLDNINNFRIKSKVKSTIKKKTFFWTVNVPVNTAYNLKNFFNSVLHLEIENFNSKISFINKSRFNLSYPKNCFEYLSYFWIK